MKVKRIATVAVMGLLAVVGVSACRVESGAALFVQDQRIEESRVDSIVRSAPEVLASGNQALDTGDLRQVVVGRLTITEMAKLVSAQTGQPLPGPDYATAASRYNTNADNAYAKLYAETVAYQPLLIVGATPATPTDAEINEFRTFLITKTQDPALAEQVVGLAATNLGIMLGERNQYTHYLDEYNVVANPRYGDVPLLVDQLTMANGQLTYPIIITIPTTS